MMRFLAGLVFLSTLAAAADAPDKRKKIVFLVGEQEYRTAETLPVFADAELKDGYLCQFLFAKDGSNDFGDVAGALADADGLFISVRRRTPPEAQMRAIMDFVKRGKPVIGIRTASHAFSLRGKPVPAGHLAWEKFDPEVFGGHYHGHHGSAAKSSARPIGDHPILAGLSPESFPTGGSLYEVLPLEDGATILMEGRAEGIKQPEPVAWVFETEFGGRSFYTSLGHLADFKRDEFILLLKRGIDWAFGTGKALPDGASSPEQSHRQMVVPGDLEMDLVLAEPQISQPLHLSFDAKGRLWVVEYRQYPHPAGLRALSRDAVWRVAYERMPPPPPHAAGSPFRGKDRISIHEDSDGDGSYDTHKVFMDGLNMVTSIAHDSDGIWVTNPPYLLFVPDRDGDDTADPEVEVHLRGFGLEDSHSIANSLTWGLDGWLYGAQGSTVSAAITRPDQHREDDAIKSMGQNIWRYHPRRKTYEIFAEGGGNAFGLEIDSGGNVFSGHNGGDTRGFHYWPGAYYRKSWGKHGALTNPHAYGFFPAMKNVQVERFTHQFIIYEDERLPERYRGKLWGVDVMHHNIVLSDLISDGSTFRTEDIERVVSSSDPWFRPVMVTDAPDGSIFIADWYDKQVNHYRNHEGQIDPNMGRVYRVRAKGSGFSRCQDMRALSAPELANELQSASRWKRRTALRLLQQRAGPGGDTEERRLLRTEIAGTPQWTETASLEQIWTALRWGLGISPAELIGHADPNMRRIAWKTTPGGDLPASVLAKEIHPAVIAEAVSAAKRIGGGEGIAIAAAIARRDEFADDPHIPMLIWWALEAGAMEQHRALLGLFSDSTFWRHKIVRDTILERLMRRYAAEESVASFERCARLLRLAPDDSSKQKLIAGFEQAIAGHSVGKLPELLVIEFAANAELLPLSLQLRVGTKGARETALSRIEDDSADPGERIELIGILGEAGSARELLALLGSSPPVPVALACLEQLSGNLATDQARGLVLGLTAAKADPTVREAAIWTLAGDREGARALLAQKSIIFPSDGGLLAEKLRAHKDPEVDRRVSEIWPQETGNTVDEAEIARLEGLVAAEGGVPKKGEEIFRARCASCHRMFDKGGAVGPDLTSYQRSDQGALLLAILAPSAEIREGYEHTMVRLKDGAVHSGFRIGGDERSLSLRTISGSTRTFSHEKVDSITASKLSLMPPGLLGGLGDAELRNFFAYLRSTTPPF